MISNTSIPNSGNTVDDFPREYVYEEDDGMYVYDVKVRSKYSDATEVPAPEAKKPGHKRTDPGIYDDLYDYNLDAPIDDGSPDQTVLKKENVCLNHKKSLISCVLGIFLVGALTVGVVFSLQVSSEPICKVRGRPGNGTERGSCSEGLRCYSDGSCQVPVEECNDIAEWCDQGHQDCSVPDVKVNCHKHCGLCGVVMTTVTAPSTITIEISTNVSRIAETLTAEQKTTMMTTKDPTTTTTSTGESWLSKDSLKLYGTSFCQNRERVSNHTSQMTLYECQTSCKAKLTCTAYQNDLRSGGRGYCFLCAECYFQDCVYEGISNSRYITYFKPHGAYACNNFTNRNPTRQDYDYYCFVSQINGEEFCIGSPPNDNPPIHKCTDINGGIKFSFKRHGIGRMRFNQAGQQECQNYHPKYLQNLAKALGYQNYKVAIKTSGNHCRLAWIDASGSFQTSSGDSTLKLPNEVSFTE